MMIKRIKIINSNSNNGLVNDKILLMLIINSSNCNMLINNKIISIMLNSNMLISNNTINISQFNNNNKMLHTYKFQSVLRKEDKKLPNNNNIFKKN